jgi:hypothetical protein
VDNHLLSGDAIITTNDAIRSSNPKDVPILERLFKKKWQRHFSTKKNTQLQRRISATK